MQSHRARHTHTARVVCSGLEGPAAVSQVPVMVVTGLDQMVARCAKLDARDRPQDVKHALRRLPQSVQLPYRLQAITMRWPSSPDEPLPSQQVINARPEHLQPQ